MSALDDPRASDGLSAVFESTLLRLWSEQFVPVRWVVLGYAADRRAEARSAAECILKDVGSSRIANVELLVHRGNLLVQAPPGNSHQLPSHHPFHQTRNQTRNTVCIFKLSCQYFARSLSGCQQLGLQTTNGGITKPQIPEGWTPKHW